MIKLIEDVAQDLVISIDTNDKSVIQSMVPSIEDIFDKHSVMDYKQDWLGKRLTFIVPYKYVTDDMVNEFESLDYVTVQGYRNIGI